jgi:hypothetical protein
LHGTVLSVYPGTVLLSLQIFFNNFIITAVL